MVGPPVDGAVLEDAGRDGRRAQPVLGVAKCRIAVIIFGPRSLKL